jgi:hypothetical protein
MSNSWTKLFPLVLLSGASVFFGATAHGQDERLAGICFGDQAFDERCSCLDSNGNFDPARQYGTNNARLCQNIPDTERERLSGVISIPPIAEIVPPPPPGILPPPPPGILPPPPTIRLARRDNGIGNGIDAAPGHSDVTNGDAADGHDSGGNGPNGAGDGVAANGRPAGENHNKNANK